MSASECKRYLLILLGGREISAMHAGYGNGFGFLCSGEDGLFHLLAMSW